MGGWDFTVFWLAGQAILRGESPYSVPYFYYPLPAAYGFSLLALLPLPVSFVLWTLFNLGLLIVFFRKKFWHWLFYTPVLHMFSSGQVELLWWSMECYISRNLLGALLAAIITLKPQNALILLPWHLYDWLRNDRRLLIYWFGFTVLIWGSPLLWYQNWLLDWLQAVPSNGLSSAMNAPGIFSLLSLKKSWWPILAVMALIIFIWGQMQSKQVARSCALLASPGGLFYTTLTLLGCAPALLLVPISILAVVLTLLTRTFIPFLMLPLAVILWHKFRDTTLLGKVTYEA